MQLGTGREHTGWSESEPEEKSEESGLGRVLHFLKGNRRRNSQQSAVYSMSVSVLQVFSTHEVRRHNTTHPQDTQRTKKETSVQERKKEKEKYLVSYVLLWILDTGSGNAPHSK